MIGFGMDFTIDFLNKNSDITGEIFMNIAKYSSGDLIITDEKFNIVFHNSKNTIKNHNTTLFDIMENFLNDNIRITIENFKNSQNNHIFLKLIFNAENNFQNIPIDLHISKLKNKKGKIKGYIVIIHDITQEIRNRRILPSGCIFVSCRDWLPFPLFQGHYIASDFCIVSIGCFCRI